MGRRSPTRASAVVPPRVVVRGRRRRAHVFGIGVACVAVALAGGCGGSSSATTASASTQTPIPANARPAYRGRVGEGHDFSTASAIVAALATAGLPCSGAHSIAYTGAAAPNSDIACTLRGTAVQVNVDGDATALSAGDEADADRLMRRRAGERHHEHLLRHWRPLGRREPFERLYTDDPRGPRRHTGPGELRSYPSACQRLAAAAPWVTRPTI